MLVYSFIAFFTISVKWFPPTDCSFVAVFSVMLSELSDANEGNYTMISCLSGTLRSLLWWRPQNKALIITAEDEKIIENFFPPKCYLVIHFVIKNILWFSGIYRVRLSLILQIKLFLNKKLYNYFNKNPYERHRKASASSCTFLLTHHSVWLLIIENSDKI